jgi:hypothetical protein
MLIPEGMTWPSSTCTILLGKVFKSWFILSSLNINLRATVTHFMQGFAASGNSIFKVWPWNKCVVEIH